MQETCCFCSHANPVGAKFCNECGSPMSMRPCGHCDAVTPRGASECHVCRAPLEPVSYGMSELSTPTERIMADADAMLAALKRDLEISARSAASEVAAPPEPLVARVVEAPPPEAPEPQPLPMAIVGDSRDEVADDVKVWVDPAVEPVVEEEREEREWRPRRGRVIGMAALALVFVAAPAILWVQRNPDTVRAWGDRLSAIANGSVDTPAQVESVAAPQAPAATTSTEQQIAPVGGATPEASPVPAPPAPADSADASAPGSAEPPKAEVSSAPPVAAPAEQARSRSTKARSGSRSTSRSRSASRDRVRQ